MSAETAKRKFALNTFIDSVKKKNGITVGGPCPGSKSSKPRSKLDPFGGGEFDLSKMPLSVNPFALVPPDVKDFAMYTSGYGSAVTNSVVESPVTTTSEEDDDTVSSASSASHVDDSGELFSSPSRKLNWLIFGPHFVFGFPGCP